jgi:hypothetical protein
VGRCVRTFEVGVGLGDRGLCVDVQGHARYYTRIPGAPEVPPA